MKRLLTGLVAIAVLGVPIVSHAQNRDMEYDAAGPPPYNDVEDGQLLKIASYIVMPVGWALEHGLTRPLHYLATDTAAAPVLSGDTDEKFFGETANASVLPPDTFRPFVMPANPTQMDTGAGPAVVPNNRVVSYALPPVTSQAIRTTTTTTTVTPAPGPNSLGQTVIH
jgi:hypothetical protein